MTAAGTPAPLGPDVVRLVDIRDQPLDIDEVRVAVADAGSGGACLFIGTVRDHDSGREVRGLGYSAHPTAKQQMRAVAEAVARRHDARAVAAVHRVGDLAIGDVAVVVGVAAAHRGTAFEACQALIDELKQTAPIWKHQLFGDGTDEWVGTP